MNPTPRKSQPARPGGNERLGLEPRRALADQSDTPPLPAQADLVDQFQQDEEISSVLTRNHRNILTPPVPTTTYGAKIPLDTASEPPAPWPRTLPVQTGLQESVHERHWDLRRKIILALEAGYSSWFLRTANALASCSSGAAFFVDPRSGKVKPWVSRCHNRMCLYCGIARSAKVAEQLLLLMNKMSAPRLMVLTIKSVNSPLDRQIAFLRRSWSKLWRKKAVKKLIIGGAYTIEVTRNPETALWHPHINLVVDGLYFPQKYLSNLWREVTGTAGVVWVCKVEDRAGAAKELAKYIGKPQHCQGWPDEAIRNYARAVAGTRLVQTFGKFFGVKVQDRDRDDDESPDTYRVKLSTLIYLADHGMFAPQKLLVLIADRWPQFRSYIYHQLPRLEKPKGSGDQLRRLRSFLEGRPPPRPPPDRKAADVEKADHAIFIAFCQYQADDEEGLFTDLQYQ